MIKDKMLSGGIFSKTSLKLLTLTCLFLYSINSTQSNKILHVFCYFQITVTSGVGASLDLMAHALADPGGEYIPCSIFYHINLTS